MYTNNVRYTMDIISSNGTLLYNNQEVMIKGVNWFGFETNIYALHGLWQVSFALLLSFVSKNNFNALRIPISTELALNLDGIMAQSINIGQNPNMMSWSSGQLLDHLVTEAEKLNILIMFDIHKSTGNSVLTDLWYDNTYTEADLIQAWTNLVTRYQKHKNVFACDLKNEPRASSTWGGDIKTDWKSAAERIGNAILALNPKLLIFVEGVEQYNGQSSWWGGNLQGVQNNPVKLNIPGKLIYSNHVYGPAVYQQPYFNDPTFPDNMPSIWTKDFGYIQQNKLGTVIIGEWGGTMSSQNKDDIWQRSMAQYIVKNKMSFFYWCLNPQSHDTGGLLENDWITPVQSKLDLLDQIMPNPTIFNISPSPTSSPSSLSFPPPVSPSPPQVSPSPLSSPPPVSSPPSPQPSLLPSNIVVSMTLVNSWKNNINNFYQEEIKIINQNNYTMKNLYISISFDKIENSWNSVLYGNVFSFPDWLVLNSGLKPNQSFLFGFIASGKQPQLISYIYL